LNPLVEIIAEGKPDSVHTLVKGEFDCFVSNFLIFHQGSSDKTSADLERGAFVRA